LRQWQREWREENSNINNKVRDFWAKQMPDADDQSPDEDDKTDDNLREKGSSKGEEEDLATERSFVTGEEAGMLDSRDAHNGSHTELD